MKVMKPNPRDRLVAGSFITITLDKFVIQGLNLRHILAHQYLCDVTKLREVLSYTLGSCLPGKTTDEHFARIVGDLLTKDTQVEGPQRKELLVQKPKEASANITIREKLEKS